MTHFGQGVADPQLDLTEHDQAARDDAVELLALWEALHGYET
jgi:hypothetical protein